MAKKHFSRSDRVSEQMQRELAEILRFELKDPRIGWVTITDVDVTRDYSHAKVFYTVMTAQTQEERAASQAALTHAAGFLRNEIGKRIKLYSTPQLHFVYDESIERGVHMSSLIDKVARADALLPQDDDAQDDETPA